MKHAIIYSTRTGNTELLAENVEEAIGKENVSYFGRRDGYEGGDDGIVFVGFWTDKGKPDAESEALLKSLRGRKVFLFGSAGFGESQDYYDKIIGRAEKMMDKSSTLIGSWMCQGKMPLSVKERYQKMKDSHMPIPNIDRLMENFDKALSHPDDEDLRALRKAVAEVI